MAFEVIVELSTNNGKIEHTAYDKNNISEYISMNSDLGINKVTLKGSIEGDCSNIFGSYLSTYSIKEFDLSKLKTTGVTNMSNMFYGGDKIQHIYVGNGWDTSSVTTSTNMFGMCLSLTNFSWSNPTDVSMAKPVEEGGYLDFVGGNFNIYLGNNKINKIYLGNNEIAKIYLGNSEL